MSKNNNLLTIVKIFLIVLVPLVAFIFGTKQLAAKETRIMAIGNQRDVASIQATLIPIIKSLDRLNTTQDIIISMLLELGSKK